MHQGGFSFTCVGRQEGAPYLQIQGRPEPGPRLQRDHQGPGSSQVPSVVSRATSCPTADVVVSRPPEQGPDPSPGQNTHGTSPFCPLGTLLVCVTRVDCYLGPSSGLW